MIALAYDDADGFVTKQQHRGIDVRWDGWVMVFTTPHKAARRSPNGHYSRTLKEYGFETRVSPNNQGKWYVDSDLVKRIGSN